jgi:hypothetical protein
MVLCVTEVTLLITEVSALSSLNEFSDSFLFYLRLLWSIIDVQCRHSNAAVVVKGKTLMTLFRSVFIEDG